MSDAKKGLGFSFLLLGAPLSLFLINPLTL